MRAAPGAWPNRREAIARINDMYGRKPSEFQLTAVKRARARIESSWHRLAAIDVNGLRLAHVGARKAKSDRRRGVRAMRKISVIAARDHGHRCRGICRPRCARSGFSSVLAYSATPEFELIAFEVSGLHLLHCIPPRRAAGIRVCRQPAKPRPSASSISTTKPATGCSLNEPVRIVPTVVVMKDGAEVGRIVGYLGPQNFYRVLDGLLPRRSFE